MIYFFSFWKHESNIQIKLNAEAFCCGAWFLLFMCKSVLVKIVDKKVFSLVNIFQYEKKIFSFSKIKNLRYKKMLSAQYLKKCIKENNDDLVTDHFISCVNKVWRYIYLCDSE